MEPRAAVREALERGERAALVTVTGLEGDPPAREGMALGVLESGASFGTLGCDGFDRAGATDAARALREQIRLERTYDWDDSSRVRVEVRPFAPGDLLKLYLWGYLNKVRSSRRLELEYGRNQRSALALAKAAA